MQVGEIKLKGSMGWISSLATGSLDAHLKPTSGVGLGWGSGFGWCAEGSVYVALLMLHDYILHSIRCSERH